MTDNQQFNLEKSVPEINARLAKIDHYLGKANEMRISAGEILFKAKTEVLRLKADGQDITWKGWVESNIKRSYADVNKCIKLITAENPDEALEADRKKDREAKQAKREIEKLEAEKTSEVDPTEGIDDEDEPDTSDIPEAGEDWFEKAKLVEPEPDIVDEVDEILKVKPESDFDILQQRVMYWLKHTATFQDLLDLTSYIDIPPIPKLEGEVEKAEPVTRGAVLKPEVEEPVEDEPESEVEADITELDPENDLEFKEESEDDKEDEDGPVREGLENFDPTANDDLTDMPDFLKRF